MRARCGSPFRCLDEAGPAAIRRLHARAPNASGHLRAFAVPYIVTTARNRAAPIGRFTRTVDKGSPEAVVSFCRTGIRKVDPTVFRWEAGITCRIRTCGC